MPRAAIDPPTKTCAACGSTFHRKRNRHGNLQSSNQWRKQTTCSLSCARALDWKNRPEVEHRKTCEACGSTYERARYGGRLEPRGLWLKRRACSTTCAGRLRTIDTTRAREARTGTCVICGNTTRLDTKGRPRQTCSQACRNEVISRALTAKSVVDAHEHPPCVKCGRSVGRKPGEKPGRWMARKTCSQACAGRLGAEPRVTAKRERATRERRQKKLAPDGYVFDGRFPTPAGLRSGWQTVSGPDTGRAVTFGNNGVTRSPETVALLRSALSDHPDLLDALAGTLTDSWVQQDAATRTPIT